MGGRRMRATAAAVTAGAMAASMAIAGTALAADQGVTIAGFAFGPSTVTVDAGDTVTWTNNDSAPHTATGDGFDTGSIGTGGGTASVTFEVAGTFSYVCSIHPSMTGTVIVQGAGGSGGGGNPTTPPTDAADGTGAADAQGGVSPTMLAALALAGFLGIGAITLRLASAPARTRDED